MALLSRLCKNRFIFDKQSYLVGMTSIKKLERKDSPGLGGHILVVVLLVTTYIAKMWTLNAGLVHKFKKAQCYGTSMRSHK